MLTGTASDFRLFPSVRSRLLCTAVKKSKRWSREGFSLFRDLTEYISLLSEDGSEKMIIRSISSLDGDSAEAVRGCLGEYYRIPQITSFDGCTDKFGVLKFTVNTNFGEASFSVKNRHSDIKLLCGKRILIKDSSDNRYEVPDHEYARQRSQRLISSYL